MPGITIRLADLTAPEDRAAICRLTREYSATVFNDGSFLSDEVLARLPDAMLAHGGIRTFMAFDDSGSAVGLATCITSFSTFAAAPVLNIHDLCVTETQRGQGVGALLLEAVEAAAREQGYAKVTLEVVHDNPARRLYARAGLVEDAIFCVKMLK